jgi:hypothetical protein
LARRLKQKQDAKERLKSKGAVPSRNGKPIFEGSGDLQQFALSFRRHYYSSRPLRFKEWIEVVAEYWTTSEGYSCLTVQKRLVP